MTLKPIWIMAVAEIREGLRNRWVAAAIITLTVFAVSLALLGSTPVGDLKASRLNIATASLASLSGYLIPLIALMLAFDAIVGEAERGTLLLLLTYPIARWQIIMGKFAGHLCIMGVAIVVGYGAAGLYIATTAPVATTDLLSYGMAAASSFLLGAVFLSIGYLLSTQVQERATAVGAALIIWLLLTVVYDLALLAIIVADLDQIVTGPWLAALIYFNPSDIYRLFNLSGNNAGGIISGMGSAGASGFLPAWGLVTAMLVWIGLPLLTTITLFHQRDI